MTRAFWTRVDMSAGPDGCWPWLGTRKEDGRGRLIIGGKFVYAYRYAWELTNGAEIPAGLLACHRCDNPGCVNPRHIFIGTHRDNNRDAASKGRTRNLPAPRGEIHWNAHNTDEQVEQARRLYATGMRQAAIAEFYGVSQSTVSRWVLGRVRSGAAWLQQLGEIA